MNVKKILVLAFISMCLKVNYAQDSYAKTERSGAISGRIIDEQNLPLPGASIFLKEIEQGTSSDANGFYRFSGISTGKYTLTVSYIGYETQSKMIEVSNEVVEVDFKITEGIALKEIVISSYMQGQNKAINQQKNSVNITNIVSADQVGRFPDANIGDALKRIPGINVQYDQGEARFGHVRGTAPEFNSVMLDGDRIPSAEAETRSVQLDLVPADMIQTVEVNKVVTPDMDADAIGGAINLITKSNPYDQRISATLSSGYNFLVNKIQYSGGALYGNRFKMGKKSSVGMVFSVSYQNNNLGSDNIEAEWKKNKNGSFFMEDFQQRTYYLTRERQSYSAAFDFNFNKNHKIELKGIFNHRKDWENRYRLRYKDIKQKEDGSWIAEIRRQTKGGNSATRFKRLEDQKIMNFALSGEHHFGKIEVDWKGSYAKASEERPNERYLSMRAKKVTVAPDISDTKKPIVNVIDEGRKDLSSNFSLKELTEEFQFTDEIDKKGKLDVKIPLLKGDFKSKIKIGGRFKAKEKQRNNRFFEYDPANETVFLNDALSTAKDQSKSNFSVGKKYVAGKFIDNKFLGNTDLNNATNFEKKESLEEESGNFEAKENVWASYIRYDQKVGDKLKIIAGLRLEQTALEYSGRELNVDEKGKVLSLNKTKKENKSYTNLLPSVIVQYKFSRNTQIKAAYTNTIARPKYYDLVPHYEINLEDMKMNIGNPGLKPTHSMNLDLMGEHYFSSMGLASAGFFYKKITNFVVTQEFKDYTFNEKVWEKFKKPINGGNANLFGIEVAFQKQLDFLPAFLKNFGIYTNYTFTKSVVKNFQVEGRENEKISLPGTPEHTFNVSLFYETKKLSIRSSLNFSDHFIDEVGTSTFYDRYYDRAFHLDLNANYTINKYLNIFAEANNLLNQPLRYYQGDINRVMQEEYYGIKINIGLKFNL